MYVNIKTVVDTEGWLMDYWAIKGCSRGKTLARNSTDPGLDSRLDPNILSTRNQSIYKLTR